MTAERVLVCLAGLSPQVVTETVWAVLVSPLMRPAVAPVPADEPERDAVHVRLGLAVPDQHELRCPRRRLEPALPERS